MKKKLQPAEDKDAQHQLYENLEITKAVAQAWLSYSESSRPANEFDAHRRNYTGKHSRFKLEAVRKSKTAASAGGHQNWDFRQSLWDSYEIVTVAKKLETGLAFDNPFTELAGESSRMKKRRKESKNSLRYLFNRMSSRRFNKADLHT